MPFPPNGRGTIRDSSGGLPRRWSGDNGFENGLNGSGVCHNAEDFAIPRESRKGEGLQRFFRITRLLTTRLTDRVVFFAPGMGEPDGDVAAASKLAGGSVRPLLDIG